MLDFILLIPYYNNHEGLVMSLKSINYPANRFEVIIVDDGSTESLKANSLKELFPDATIKVISLPENAGIAKALNAGLGAIKDRTDYQYIARLDCGDTCHKDRFTKQVEFLNTNNEVGLLGTWCTFTEKENERSYLYKTKALHKGIVKQMHFKCSFIHPTVMFRKEVLGTVGFYPENYPHAEDYAYFWKILKNYKGAIIAETLVNIEIKKGNVSSVNYRKQLHSRNDVVMQLGTNRTLKFIGSVLIFMRLLMPIWLIRKSKFLF